jgi:hypothetical protein
MTDTSVSLNNGITADDVASGFEEPTIPLDNSFSITEIMQQNSSSAMDADTNGSGMISHTTNLSRAAAEKSSRHLLVAMLPKKSAS